MKGRVNPETGKAEITVTKADQVAIANVRNLLRRISRESPAEIVYEVQRVTVTDTGNDDSEYVEDSFAAPAERADELLGLIGWPVQTDKKAVAGTA